MLSEVMTTNGVGSGLGPAVRAGRFVSLSRVASGVGVGGAVGPGGGLKVGVSVANNTTLTFPVGRFVVRVTACATAGASTVTPGGSSPRTGAGAVGGAVGRPGHGVKVGRGVLVAVGAAPDGACPTSLSPTEQARLVVTSANALSSKAKGRREPCNDLFTFGS
jgi:hypothetical protein